MSPPGSPQKLRRVTLPVGFGDEIRSRATQNGRSLTEEVCVLIRAALAEERLPPRPVDGPLERRVQELLAEDPGLTRAAATQIATAGGHDR